jgi:hypothetical protein
MVNYGAGCFDFLQKCNLVGGAEMERPIVIQEESLSIDQREELITNDADKSPHFAKESVMDKKLEYVSKSPLIHPSTRQIHRF